jgi:hypothetical protein
MTKNRISIHFDGPIAQNHAVQLRTFSKTLDHIQTAIDRAFLDLKYGAIWKNARLKEEDYAPTDFTLLQTREGGFISDLVGTGDGVEIIDRIHQAVMPAYEKAQEPVIQQPVQLADEAERRRRHYKAGAQKPIAYELLIENPDAKQTNPYGDRSIVKEFDQIASAIRARDNDGSVVEIDLYSTRSLPKFIFDFATASAFHKVVAVRTLGDPVEIPVTLRALDAGGNVVSRAKVNNLISGKEFNLFIHTVRGFGSLRKYLRKKDPPSFKIIACPVLEYGAFDPLAGDMYFIAIVNEAPDE